MLLTDATYLGATLPLQEHLDPFAYLPGVASRVGGLASGRQSDDPGYVFHTEYVTVGQGIAYVRVAFAGLRVKQGTLFTRVHMVTKDTPPRLGLVTSDRTSFNRLMQHGELVIRFEAFHDARYAIYGTIIGDTDAEADALSVVLERPEPSSDPRGIGTAPRNSSHGDGATRGVAKLVSTDAPRIEGPVSQIATPDQLTEPAAQAALKALSMAGGDPLEQWAAVYTLQVLRSYGMLRPGAIGLGFGAVGHPLAKLVAANGPRVVVTSEDPADLDADDADVVMERADHASLGRSLLNFDFLWNHDTARLQHKAADWVAGVEDMLTALLPGGLAVLTFDYDLTVPMRRLDPDGPIRIGRAEVERAALSMISRGHQVAQLRTVGKYSPLVVEGRSAAGLIIRRALLGR